MILPAPSPVVTLWQCRIARLLLPCRGTGADRVAEALEEIEADAMLRAVFDRAEGEVRA